MIDLGQWITGTATCTGADTRSEFEIIGDYLDADEAAQAAGLVLDFNHASRDGGNAGAYLLLVPPDETPLEFDTIDKVGAFIDGYMAGKAAAA